MADKRVDDPHNRRGAHQGRVGEGDGRGWRAGHPRSRNHTTGPRRPGKEAAFASSLERFLGPPFSTYYSETCLMRPPTGPKIMVVLCRWSQ